MKDQPTQVAVVAKRAPGTNRSNTKLRITTVVAGLLIFSPLAFAQVPNDDCVTATVVTSVPFTDNLNTRLASDDPNDPVLSCADGGGGKTVWYHYTPATDLVVSVSTRGSTPEDYDTALAIFTGSCDNLVEVECDDDIVDGVIRQAEIVFLARAGVLYIIHVAEWNGGGPAGGIPTGGDLVFSINEAKLYQGPADGAISGGVLVTTDDFAAAPPSGPQRPKTAGEPIPLRKLDRPLRKTRPKGEHERFENVEPDFTEDTAQPSLLANAPNLHVNFQGIPDVGSVFPPDPHTAAGPNHIMGTVNRQFAIFNKTGSLLKLINAADWLAAVLPGASPCDPQIVYDHHHNRWVMTWIECGNGTSSYLYVSVSDDDNPLGNWCIWRLPGDVNGATKNGFFNDYPKLGLDENAIYVTANMFDNRFAYVQLRVIPTAQLYNNPCGPITWKDFWDLRNPNDPSETVFTTVPAVTFGTPGVEYLVDVDFLNNTGNFVNLWSLSDPLSPTPTLAAVAVPVASFQGPPDASQLEGGFPRIDVGGRRNRNVVYQNGSVWTAHSIADPSGQYARARYVRIDVATATAIEDASLGREGFWYYYPAIHPDGNGNLVIAFTRSGTSEYASARYAGRLASDPPGLSNSLELKAGEANYVRTGSGSRNRWGDYMGIAMDPSDHSKVWMFVEYAASPADTWGTWFGSASYSTPSGCLACGDVNGDGQVNSTDALIILSFDANVPISPNFLNLINNGCGDVNSDGKTNSTDALIVLTFDAGLPVPFPVGQAGSCSP